MARRREEDTGSVETTAQDAMAGEGGPSATPAEAATQNAERRVRKYTRRNKVDPDAAQRADLEAKMQQQVEALYTPEAWEPLVRAPADLMLATSGRKLWKLEDNEAKGLAATASTAGRYFMQTDPKWIALTLFSFSLLTVYGGRALMHWNEAKREKAERENHPPKANV